MNDNESSDRPKYHHGHWIVVNFESNGIWIKEDVEIIYKGYKLIAMAGDKHYPAIAMEHTQRVEGDPPLDWDGAQTILLNYLSALSWHEGIKIEIQGFSGGNYPSRYSRDEKAPRIQTEKVNFFDEVPEVFEEREKLALALMREARSVNNAAYQFLSYSKIFNIDHAGSTAQKAWMNASLHDLRHDAKKRAEALQADGLDVGEYLYNSGRSAVAHANVSPDKPIINPDNWGDYKRLYADMPLVAALAEKYVEKEIGIKGSHALYEEHLYELKGFKSFVPTDIVERCKKGEEVGEDEFPKLPSMSFRLRGDKQYEILDNLTCEVVAIEQGAVFVDCFDEVRMFRMQICLNFQAERFQTNFFEGELYDDKTAKAMEYIAEFYEFRLRYLMNGILEAWAPDYELMLGRCDAFVPVNMMVDYKGGMKQIEGFRDEAKRRREKEVPAAGVQAKEAKA